MSNYKISKLHQTDLFLLCDLLYHPPGDIKTKMNHAAIRSEWPRGSLTSCSAPRVQYDKNLAMALNISHPVFLPNESRDFHKVEKIFYSCYVKYNIIMLTLPLQFPIYW